MASSTSVVSSRGDPFRGVISLPATNPETAPQIPGQITTQQPYQGPFLVTASPGTGDVVANPSQAGYIEYPAAGNIPPSTDPYAYIDPTTGQVLSPLPGASVVSTITSWVQANPILALALAAGAVWLLMDFFNGGGGGHIGRRRR